MKDPMLWLTCPIHPDAASCWYRKDKRDGVWCYECRHLIAIVRDTRDLDVPAHHAAESVVMHWDDMVYDHPDRKNWDFADSIEVLRRTLMGDTHPEPIAPKEEKKYLSPLLVIEKITGDGNLPKGFMSHWSGPPESIPEGWKLASLDWFKAEIADEDDE